MCGWDEDDGCDVMVYCVAKIHVSNNKYPTFESAEAFLYEMMKELDECDVWLDDWESDGENSDGWKFVLKVSMWGNVDSSTDYDTGSICPVGRECDKLCGELEACVCDWFDVDEIRVDAEVE